MAGEVVFKIKAEEAEAVQDFLKLARAQGSVEAATKKTNVALEKQVANLTKANKALTEKAVKSSAGGGGGGFEAAKVLPSGFIGKGASDALLGLVGLSSAATALQTAAGAIQKYFDKQTAEANRRQESAGRLGPGLLTLPPEERANYIEDRNKIALQTGTSLEEFEPIKNALFPLIKDREGRRNAMENIALGNRIGLGSIEELTQLEKRGIEQGFTPGLSSNLLLQEAKISGNPEELKSLLPKILNSKDIGSAIAAAMSTMRNYDSVDTPVQLDKLLSFMDAGSNEALRKSMGGTTSTGGAFIEEFDKYISNKAAAAGKSKDEMTDRAVKLNLIDKETAEALKVLANDSSYQTDKNRISNTINDKTGFFSSSANLYGELSQLAEITPNIMAKMDEDSLKVEQEIRDTTNNFTDADIAAMNIRNRTRAYSREGRDDQIDPETAKLETGVIAWLNRQAIEYNISRKEGREVGEPAKEAVPYESKRWEMSLEKQEQLQQRVAEGIESLIGLFKNGSPGIGAPSPSSSATFYRNPDANR